MNGRRPAGERLGSFVRGGWAKLVILSRPGYIDESPKEKSAISGETEQVLARLREVKYAIHAWGSSEKG